MEKDLQKKGYFYDPERFADLINGVVCSGKQVLLSADLTDIVNNYKIYLCEVRKFENTDVFRTDLKQVFDCVKYSDDPERLYELVVNDPAYREMNGDTYDLIAQYTGTNELMQVKRYKEGKVDMCKAITELIERGRREGMEQGIEQTIHIMKKLNIEKVTAIEHLAEAFGIGRDDASKRVESNW